MVSRQVVQVPVPHGGAVRLRVGAADGPVGVRYAGGPGMLPKSSLENVPDARVERDDDAVVRVTSSALCGTDLHMYDGRTGAAPGLVLGHEGLGIVEDVGRAVHRVQRGDRVVLPAHIYCGVCFNCARGNSAACLRVQPGHAGGAYAMPGMGPFRGSQAELVRVPFADANCVVLPGAPGDEPEDDFVLIADAWVTGWHATELAGVRAADTAAVFGAGAIGLLAAYSARLRGASEVDSVDLIDERLAKAAELGFVPVDARRGTRPGSLASWSVHRHRRGTGSGGRSCRRVAAGALGDAVQQGGHRRVRAHARPPVHHAPARPDHQRTRPAQPDHHPPRATGERT
jgi:glutathione-independent formaldehyde dehydrogenase